jgi:Reverse transcriptase (RNA-dependent DNA polymerase)
VLCITAFWPTQLPQRVINVVSSASAHFRLSPDSRHIAVLAKVARRVDDPDVMHLLKIMRKANGRCGVPQGGVISPLLSNLYLTEVDRMLERAKEATHYGKYTYIEYARFADDLVILIDAYPRHDWMMGAVESGSGRSWPIYKSRSMRRRVESWTSVGARASASSDSTSVASAVGRAHGVPTTRRSSRNVLRCYGSSRMCSAATNRNQWIGSCS